MTTQDDAPLLATASGQKMPNSSSSQTSSQTLTSCSQVPSSSSGQGHLRKAPAVAAEPEGEEAVAAAVATDFATAWRALLLSFAGAGCYSLAAAVFRPLRTWSMFDWVGLTSVTAWGWELTVSMGYVGQGMIMGPKTVWSMLAGAAAGEREGVVVVGGRERGG